MKATELFGEVVELKKDIIEMSTTGCDDSNCSGYQDCDQCNPDAD